MINITAHIDFPSLNDNRSYDYSKHPETERKEYSIISKLIKENSSVIDLGCGNGTLLSLLKKQKNIRESGIELSESGVAICKQKGLNVQLGRIDDKLPFHDNQFDYAVCNVTIQMVLYPEVLLREMKRISRHQIISFPNFAFWKNRIDLLLHGRMPRTMLFGYSWYSTGHIHQLSLADFYQLVNDVGGLSVKELHFEPTSNSWKNFLMRKFPNLFQHTVIILLEKNV